MDNNFHEFWDTFLDGWDDLLMSDNFPTRCRNWNEEIIFEECSENQKVKVINFLVSFAKAFEEKYIEKHPLNIFEQMMSGKKEANHE